MNKELSDFARAQLKENIAKCTEEQQIIFKRMYSHENLETPINQVIDGMPDSRLDWARVQVQRTVDKNAESS